MRKATHYKVSGVLETKPEDLPEGLAVEEVEITLPREKIKIIPIHGGSGILLTEYDLEDTRFAVPGVMIGSQGIYDGDEVRKLRDFLNKVLEEDTRILRTFKDADGDSWFEFEPDKFTMGGFDEEYPKALVVAENRLKEFKDTGYAGGFVNRSYKTINRDHGPLTEFKP